jgi:hypothetical protein
MAHEERAAAERGARGVPRRTADRSGGIGAVYLTTDPSLKRRLALKAVAPELADDSRFGERFLLRRSWNTRLSCRSTTRARTRGGCYSRCATWIASLAEWLADRGWLEAAEVVALLGPIAGALDAPEAAGVDGLARKRDAGAHDSQRLRASVLTPVEDLAWWVEIETRDRPQSQGIELDKV